MGSYAHFADELLIAVYEESASNPQAPCSLLKVIESHNLETDGDWLATVTHEFKEEGLWTVEIGSGPLVHLTAAGLRKAERLKTARDRGQGVSPNTHVFPIPPKVPSWKFWRRDWNWTKWGTIAAVLTLVATIYFGLKMAS